MRIAFLLLILICISVKINAQSGIDIVKSVIHNNKQIKRIKFYITANERFGNEMKTNAGTYKVNSNPLKVYLKQDIPVKDREVLFVAGWNNNHALVSPKSFPFTNISLNPFSDMMRNGYHFTILEVGLNYFTSLLEHILNKYQAEINQVITYKGKKYFKGVGCYELEINIKNYKHIDYTLKTGESITSIARKLKIPDYKIVELNNFNFFHGVSEGQTIKIPSDYAKQIILYIEISRLIPVFIKVYDEKGLYEHYEFSNITINPVFTSDEFNTSNKAYGF